MSLCLMLGRLSFKIAITPANSEVKIQKTCFILAMLEILSIPFIVVFHFPVSVCNFELLQYPTTGKTHTLGGLKES